MSYVEGNAVKQMAGFGIASGLFNGVRIVVVSLAERGIPLGAQAFGLRVAVSPLP